LPRPCSVCSHRYVALIDDALVKSVPYRRIATEFEASEEALRRHKREHLPELIAKAHEAEEATRADDLLGELRAIRDSILRLAEKAEESEDYRTALAGHTSRFKYVELLGEVREIIDRRPQVNILISPEARDTIVGALLPYDAARRAVIGALEELEALEAASS
jgi:hypothetical protein